MLNYGSRVMPEVVSTARVDVSTLGQLGAAIAAGRRGQAYWPQSKRPCDLSPFPHPPARTRLLIDGKAQLLSCLDERKGGAYQLFWEQLSKSPGYVATTKTSTGL